MVKIAPSILSASFAKLGDEIDSVVKGGADLIHLDVMDGVFVPNITFGAPVIKTLPRHEGVEFDAHLMIQNPENHIDSFVEAGVDRLAFHVESTIHVHRVLQSIREKKIKPGIALNPSTPLSMVEWILEEVDMVVIMTVNPGFGGQSFIEAVFPKVEQIRECIEKKGLTIDIEVDGGVNPNNIGRLASAGMNIAVAGSAVYGQPDYAAAIADLKNASK